MLIERLGWGLPSKGLSRSAVECVGDCLDLLGGPPGKVSAFEEVLASEAVGVLVRAARPRAVRVSEEDWDPGLDLELGVGDSSLPRSQVSERRSWSGSVVML